MIKCPSCNSENIDDSKFCYNCGARLSKDPYNLEGENREYGSLSVSKESSVSSYYDDSASYSNADSSSGSSSSSSSGSSRGFRASASSNHSNSSNSTSFMDGIRKRFMGMSKINKVLTLCCAAFIVLLILSFISYTFLGIPLEAYTEAEKAWHDYSNIDLNGDGALSLEELSTEYSNLSSSALQQIFDKCDKNDNGVLRGRECDNFVIKVNDYFKELEKEKKKAQEIKANSSSSGYSSHSKSHSSVSSSDGSETCPYCGSEAIYSDGKYYKCADCGRTIYNPDDLELNYEEGYMDLLLPVAIHS